MCTHNNNLNGLDTKIWGPYAWKTFHYATYGYPENPSEDDKKNAEQYFKNFGFGLPCESCRKSYNEFITSDETIFNDNTVTNRKTLTEWGFKLHERVNKKLNVTYYVTLDDIDNHYESSRVKCLPELEECIADPINKIKSYKIAEYNEYGIIDKNIADKFKEYAKKRNIEFNTDFWFNESKNIHSDAWIKRNEECHNINHHMKCNMIPSIEIEGEYKGYPTINELKLLMRLCSNLSLNHLNNIISSKKKYKLYKS